MTEVFLPPQGYKVICAVWLIFVFKAAGAPGFNCSSEMEEFCTVTKPAVKKTQKHASTGYNTFHCFRLHFLQKMLFRVILGSKYFDLMFLKDVKNR